MSNNLLACHYFKLKFINFSMKKIRVAIVGYGNLGKAMENLLLKQSNYNLIGIFSRRKIKSKFNTPCYDMLAINNFKSKVDIMILCGGSDSDLLKQTPEILQNFNVINTFDTHKLIKQEKEKLDIIAKKNQHYAIICCGWDPGLFSQIRILFDAISRQNSFTFWGKGVSMGHSNAVKKVLNVENAVAYTIPNEKSLKKQQPTHFRKLFVVAKSEYKKQIKNDILSNKNYFSDYPVTIKFISKKCFEKHHRLRPHAGKIVNHFNIDNFKNSLNFDVKMQDNASFTAAIVIAYLKTFEKLKENFDFGTYTLPEIPISYLNDNFLDLT